MSMPCQMLEWDTAFFGRRIARVNANRLDRTSAEAITAWCRANTIDCLYFLADPDDAATVRLAEAGDFHLVDVRLSLVNKLKAHHRPSPGVPLAAIGPVQPAEVADLRAIARVSHRDSRFYFDANFERAACDRLYETWIEQSCQDNPAGVLVARCQSETAGYSACRRLPDGSGQIALVAVAPGFQRRGLGTALLEASLAWFWEQGLRQVSVVTQGRNTGALRLYEAHGFRVERLQFWYHRWFPAPTEAKGS